MGTGILDEVRAACAFVTERAEVVGVDDDALHRFALSLPPRLRRPIGLDWSYFYRGDPATTVAYVITFNTVNFGSGWWPHVTKLPGRSGSITMMSRLRERFASAGPLSAGELAALGVPECADLFQQPLRTPVNELMTHFTRALNDLGCLLLDRYAGSFEALVEEAEGSAERLVKVLLPMPMYRDVATYQGREVPILKRAQLTPADLALALGGSGLGHFRDLDRLTVMADNLVPHVLRLEGVLTFEPELVRSIEAGELLEPGGAAETEIRAVTVDAVERIAGRLRREGETTTAWELDYVLWHAGQGASYKAKPRHRARSLYY